MSSLWWYGISKAMKTPLEIIQEKLIARTMEHIHATPIRPNDPPARPWAPVCSTPGNYNREYYEDPRREWAGDSSFLHENWGRKSPEERIQIIAGRWPECPNDLVRYFSSIGQSADACWSDSFPWPFPQAPGVLAESDNTTPVRQLDSLFARHGAKSKFRERIINLFPEHHTYVEPFGGSMKILLWKKIRSKIEIVNDRDNYLINFWRFVQTHPVELAERINSLPTSEYLFDLFQEKVSKLTPFMQAVAFYYIQRLAFNGVIRHGGRTTYATSPSVLNTHLCSVDDLRRHSERLKGVDIRNASFENVIQRANKDNVPVFFYLDPPYYETYGYRSLDEELTFGKEEQIQLRNLCREIDKKGNAFIQTNSGHEFIAELYKEFTVLEAEVAYSIAGSGEARGTTKEFVISNLDIKPKDMHRQTGMFT